MGNRTSPFPYGGHRFEFRAVGSSQNVSMVNTVLGVICAKAFKTFADKIEAGESPRIVAQNALQEHWKIVFNGDGYDKDNQKVLIRGECLARSEVMFDHYTGLVEIEKNCMIDMINQHVIPSVRAAGVGPLQELEEAVRTLEKAWDAVHAISNADDRASAARTLRLETMIDVRKLCSKAEEICPAHLWTLATYKELLFIDQH